MSSLFYADFNAWLFPSVCYTAHMNEGFIAYTKDNINLFRLLSLRSALKLEIAGMKKRGRSVYSIVKEEFGFKGSKQSVLADLQELIAQKKDENITSVQKDKKAAPSPFIPLAEQKNLLKEEKVQKRGWHRRIGVL